MMKRALAALAALICLAAAQPAAAWSEPGHRVIAEIAYARLTPEARAGVDDLIAQGGLSGEPSCPVYTLADAAVFVACVDGIRQYNDLRRLHYEAAPLCGAVNKNDYCRNGQCASEAVKAAIGVLANPFLPVADRLFALQQLAHFLGDLHQPHNMIDNRDNRGESIRVSLPGSSDRGLNLYRVWDEVLPALAVGSGELGASFIEPLAENNDAVWRAGNIDDWALETQQLARSLYARLPEPPECGRRPRGTPALDRTYVAAGVATVREQLAKSGVRLAAVLNAVLR